MRPDDGGWARPVAGSPSTHILKLDSQSHPGVVAALSCDGSGTDLIVCRPEPDQLEATAGRRVLVVLDGDLASAAEAVEAMGGTPAVVILGRPDASADALTGVGATLTFVPSGLSELLTDPLVTFLVGVNDALAAITPVEIGDDQAVLVVNRFFDSRLQDMAPEPSGPETAQGPVPELDVRWVLDLPEPLIAQGSHERPIRLHFGTR